MHLSMASFWQDKNYIIRRPLWSGRVDALLVTDNSVLQINRVTDPPLYSPPGHPARYVVRALESAGRPETINFSTLFFDAFLM